MSVTAMNTAMDAAIAAMEAGEYSDAIVSANKALAYMAIIPDSRHGSGEMRWRTSGIKDFISQCQMLQSSSTGLGSSTGLMQQQKVTYRNPDSSDC